MKERKAKNRGFIYAARRVLELINRAHHRGLDDVKDRRLRVKGA